ncbi:tetratricopeptide repeat protein [Luteirhabdus pelagi]|uniref:tetratricopeptide repeat protein n=1 Tax=Luteirhabdus pelagi TaxID=2792783 RepID=UPI00193AB849|nr:tetratricopeptide repeat protein [Luteirhabdus pelagi]
MRILIAVFFIFLVNASALSQNEALAKNYFEQGEYEKALSIYEKLYEDTPGRLDFFLSLIESHQQLEQFEEAEALLKSKLQGVRPNPQLWVQLGYNHSLQQQDSLAKQSYQKAIVAAEENPNYAYTVGRAFSDYSLLEEAVSVYTKAMQADPSKDYNIQLARLYGEQGQLDKMFSSYIDLMQSNPSYRAVAQRNFSSYITEDPLNEANEVLRRTLLQQLQNNPQLLYNQLLSWLFVQQKEYRKAFAQEKAIYKRSEEETLRGVLDLALIAISEEAYEDAEEFVQFLIDNSYSPEAKLQGHQYMMTIALKTTPPEDYPKLEKRFEELLNEYGRNASTYKLQTDYNEFLAFKAGKKEQAIQNLKDLLATNLNSYREAHVKMTLADILVFDEKFNQALIYYSQIQSKLEGNVLAQEARFKVAKTSYYKGDFEWAQVQLDVLRKSASQLIANDAMQLSLMIRDNSLEDSTQTALKKYARADLLALQNKNEEAITLLDDILIQNKGEKIEDEALLKQAKIYEAVSDYENAEANYLKLIEFYKDDILADDAFFLLAKLYEEKLGLPEKAKEYYEQIIFSYADSIYFVQARKRYRSLRGDAIE